MIILGLIVFAAGVAGGFALALTVYRPRPQSPTAAYDALDRIHQRRRILDEVGLDHVPDLRR